MMNIPYAARRVYATVMPTCVISHDGKITFRHDFTTEQQEYLRLLDEALDALRTTLFEETG